MRRVCFFNRDLLDSWVGWTNAAAAGNGRTLDYGIRLHVIARDTSEQAWAEADPYARAGLFESVTISEWKKVVG